LSLQDLLDRYRPSLSLRLNPILCDVSGTGL
jgi:hypothetical protein